jgi:hypothetical protein
MKTIFIIFILLGLVLCHDKTKKYTTCWEKNQFYGLVNQDIADYLFHTDGMGRVKFRGDRFFPRDKIKNFAKTFLKMVNFQKDPQGNYPVYAEEVIDDIQLLMKMSGNGFYLGNRELNAKRINVLLALAFDDCEHHNESLAQRAFIWRDCGLDKNKLTRPNSRYIMKYDDGCGFARSLRDHFKYNDKEYNRIVDQRIHDLEQYITRKL